MTLLAAVASGAAPFQPLHPLRYWGYQFWSGIGSDIAEITVLTSMIALGLGFWRHHNCHIRRCWRLRWHVHPDHGHPVCRRHLPQEHHPPED